MGTMINQKVIQVLVPSTSAASRISSGIDCSPASKTSITKGVHSQATIKVTLSRGNVENQATAGRPTACNAQSITPKSGLSVRQADPLRVTPSQSRQSRD